MLRFHSKIDPILSSPFIAFSLVNPAYSTGFQSGPIRGKVTLNHWVVGSIPTRCKPLQELLTYVFT
jgi:hypothetical protein